MITLYYVNTEGRVIKLTIDDCDSHSKVFPSLEQANSESRALLMQRIEHLTLVLQSMRAQAAQTTDAISVLETEIAQKQIERTNLIRESNRSTTSFATVHTQLKQLEAEYTLLDSSNPSLPHTPSPQ